MLPIEAAILRTVLYADVFNFPLTLDEIHRYLISDQRFTKQAIQNTLAQSSQLTHYLYQSSDYICLKTHQEIIGIRTIREAISIELWNQAMQYGQLLSHIPFVEMVALTGALAVRNPSAVDDDFDYLLITQPKRVWLARFFAVIMVRIIRLFGRELCPNYVLASDQLQQSRQDLYIAHEITQMQPIYGEILYQKMVAQNQWVQSYLPNMTAYATSQDQPRRLRKGLEWVLSGWLGDRLEAWEYRRKMNKFSAKLAQVQSSAEINQGSVKGHFKDHGEPVMVQYEALLEQYGLLERQEALAGD